MSDQETPGPGRSLAAMGGGVLLSFLAMGVLWIGTAWSLQLLMAIPFFVLTWGLIRGAPGAANQLATFVACGAAPLGMMVVRFRDASGSHLTSVLVVCAWAAGVGLGWFLGRKR